MLSIAVAVEYRRTWSRMSDIPTVQARDFFNGLLGLALFVDGVEQSFDVFEFFLF